MLPFTDRRDFLIFHRFRDYNDTSVENGECFYTRLVFDAAHLRLLRSLLALLRYGKRLHLRS